MFTQLWGGTPFDLEDFRRNSFCPDQAATSLSRIYRYNGNTRWLVTVAQHSCEMAYRASDSLALACLLHDWPESIVSDIPKPVKMLCPGDGILKLTRRIEEWVFDLHRIPLSAIEGVSVLDREAIATELRDIAHKPQRSWNLDVRPWPEKLVPWHPEYARDEWRRLYDKFR